MEDIEEREEEQETYREKGKENDQKDGEELIELPEGWITKTIDKIENNKRVRMRYWFSPEKKMFENIELVKEELMKEEREEEERLKAIDFKKIGWLHGDKVTEEGQILYLIDQPDKKLIWVDERILMREQPHKVEIYHTYRKPIFEFKLRMKALILYLNKNRDLSVSVSKGLCKELLERKTRRKSLLQIKEIKQTLELKVMSCESTLKLIECLTKIYLNFSLEFEREIKR